MTASKVVLGIGVIIITGCNPLKKMVERANEVSVIFSPNPLVVVDDSIEYSLTIKFPAKYFHKKVKGTITPVIKDARTGEQIGTLKSLTFLGESVEGEGIKIPFEKGGSGSVSEKLPYDPKYNFIIIEGQVSGQFKSKSANILSREIARGTIRTHQLVQQDEKSSFVKGIPPKEVAESYFYDIHYDKAKYNLRPQELKQNDVQEIPNFIKNMLAEDKKLIDITIDGYASPEGEIAFNNNLSVDRTKTAQNHLTSLLKRLKEDKKQSKDFAQLDPSLFEKSIRVEGRGEDWNKFKSDLENSDVKDKDLVLRILQMYQDPVQREKEIRNLAKIFDELEKKVFPKQRRAEVKINVSKKPRTPQEIIQLVRSNPDILTADEFLVAAEASTSLDEKLLIYQVASQKHPQDWRIWNNLGAVYILKKNVSEAEKALNKASQINKNSPEINNNLGIISRWQGKLREAEEYYKNASNLPEANYNLGVLYLSRGRAGDALGKIADAKSLNAAIVNILTGNASRAPQIVEESGEANTPIGAYIIAIAGARTQNKDLMIKNLKSAISKDNTLRQRAKQDAEFINYKDDAEYKNIIE